MLSGLGELLSFIAIVCLFIFFVVVVGCMLLLSKAVSVLVNNIKISWKE